MEKISFITSDEVTIVGNFKTVSGAKKAVLLLHMMPATKESFEPLQRELEKINIASLAIDLRGHGESTNSPQGKLNYQKFQDNDHQKSRLDVDAGLTWLSSRDFSKSNISVVGASIGANLAIDLLARERELKKAVLLSPGLNYRGVLIDTAAKNIDASQKIMLVATNQDTYSADSVRQLSQILSSTKSELILYSGEEHGTNMWKTNPELFKKIIDFLQ